MSAFLTDTLLWTGALIALVLLIRRPVASIFGPRAAYALWALPMARLLLPPLVLPAWMAPSVQPALDAGAPVVIDDATLTVLAENSSSLAVGPIEPAPSLFASLADLDWASVLIPLWLAGAALFLVRRYGLYFEMRRELLAEARPMGEAGRVRLVETPAADGPVAFGVIDKVIALPMGFMAGPDRAARDLALAHELAHHRGHDLTCNMLVQPLFALHWFNPLATLGWRALRRDQEAACDARVIASCPRERRADYATVIARFATRPRNAARLALAAPMACPVLGDRSIVQRLKSLTMTDISARRRWSGRLLIAAGVLALPLTGSISYAQSEPIAPETPPAPPAPVSPVTPPAAVAPPAAVTPPTPPAPPSVTVSRDGKVRIVRIERREGGKAGDGKERRVERHVIVRPGAHAGAEDHARFEKESAGGHGKGHVIIRDGKAFRDGREMSAEERAEFEKDMRELRKELREELGENGELRRELERELGENSEFQKEMREKFGKDGEFRREMRIAIADAHAGARAAARAPKVTVQCRQGQQEIAQTVVAKDGRQRIFVCNSLATAEARRAIAVARAEIARTRELTDRQRAEAMRSLDEAERESRAD